MLIQFRAKVNRGSHALVAKLHLVKPPRLLGTAGLIFFSCRGNGSIALFITSATPHPPYPLFCLYSLYTQVFFTMASVTRLSNSALRASLRAPARATAFNATRCYSAKAQVRNIAVFALVPEASGRRDWKEKKKRNRLNGS